MVSNDIRLETKSCRISYRNLMVKYNRTLIKINEINLLKINSINGKIRFQPNNKQKIF